MSELESKPQAAKGWAARIAGLLLGIVLLIVGVLQFTGGLRKLGGGAASNSEIAIATTQAKGAVEAFGAQATNAYKSGQPPRQTDPETGPLLDLIFNTAVLRGKTPKLEDIGPLSEWLMADLRAGMIYALAGTGIDDPSKIPNDPAVFDRIGKNVVTFAPETGRYIDTSIALMGSMAEALGSPADTTGDSDQAKAGKEKMRGGMTTTIAGALQTIPTDGLTDDWRRARLDVLDEAAPKFAKALRAPQCNQLRDLAGKVSAASRDDGVKKGLATFSAALKC